MARTVLLFRLILAFALLAWSGFPDAAHAAPRDLDAVKAAGVLRHLTIPYANFVTGQGDGLDVEIVKGFAKHLGVRYESVASDWPTVFADLTGKVIKPQGANVEIKGQAPVRGDIIANGLTVLPWRTKVVNFSRPTFPTQVWLVVKSESAVTPIKPTGDIDKDIQLTRAKLRGMTVLCKTGTCLDPSLFNLEPTGAGAKLFPGSLNDLAPAVIMGEADATLLDVPDALVALQKFPGKIKIIGPMTDQQNMAPAFAKEQPRLHDEFNRYFSGLMASGEYDKMVKKYYPLVFEYMPGFFKK
ncbi:transporter substrate-binding domain-containing protein [Fundidesulfovibrio butyratiphilus]